MFISKLAGSTATLVLVCATAASAGQPQDTRPVRFWSFTEHQQGGGDVNVAGDTQVGGLLNERFTFGPAGFPFPESKPRSLATGRIRSSASGTTYEVLAQAPLVNLAGPGSPNGGAAHLDQYQSYEKRSARATLRLTITKAFVDAIDANHGLLPSECPSGLKCTPVRGIVRFHARAYAESAGGDFFRSNGVVYIDGHEGHWTIEAATTADSRSRLWANADFSRDNDVDDAGSSSHAIAELKRAVKLKVPLSSLRDGELFAVHVRLDAETLDTRGRESAVEAFVRDPQQLSPSLVQTTHLKARGAPAFSEPPIGAVAAARCPAGPKPAAGRLQLSESSYVTDEATGAPMLVLVRRSGGTTGKASATLTTSAGSATAGSDYTDTRTTVTFADGDASPRLVELPVLQDDGAEPDETFTVSLTNPRCARLGDRDSAEATIVDDDVPVEQPASFTLGGTVDGLQGSGLVLHELGADLAVGNGPFTFPAARGDGLPYDVTIGTQPSNPNQVCTVGNGAGTVSGADVTNIAVHCAPPVPPSGLDPTFGSDGRVSSPIAHGQSEAVLIQSDGSIVSAGHSGANGGIDFALTRHDPAGSLDPGFGGDGIVTTDFGTLDDEAFDAALAPNDGFVVAGRSDGFTTNRNFAVARYDADGNLDTGFGGDGTVTTDYAGLADQANAVAVQADGKIVVAGVAARTGPLGADNDFALVRYLSDGTPDPSFGHDGMVTTDLAARTEIGRAMVIQPDGDIVVAGTVGGDVALVRYTPDGNLDPSFGHNGITISDFGSDDFANAVALTANGEILIAGHTLGAGLHLDFALARYRADGGLDMAFGSGGIVKTDIGGGDDFAEGLTVDSSGRIVVVGRATSATILDIAVARYGTDGTLDSSFGSGGQVVADFHGKGEFGQDVAIQSDGRIVAAGYTANGLDTEFALMRINP